MAEQRHRRPGAHDRTVAQQRVRHLDDDGAHGAPGEEVDVVVERFGSIGPREKASLNALTAEASPPNTSATIPANTRTPSRPFTVTPVCPAAITVPPAPWIASSPTAWVTSTLWA